MPSPLPSGYCQFVLNNEGKKGKACQRICIKDPWTKPKKGRIEGGRWGWVGLGKVVAGKWRQLYLDNNLKNTKWKKAQIGSWPFILQNFPLFFLFLCFFLSLLLTLVYKLLYISLWMYNTHINFHTIHILLKICLYVHSDRVTILFFFFKKVI